MIYVSMQGPFCYLSSVKREQQHYIPVKVYKLWNVLVIFVFIHFSITLGH